MPQISRISIPLTLCLFLSTYLVFAPLNAWLDHFFDFHLDHDSIPKPEQPGYETPDGVWYEHRALYEADRYRQSEGTYGQDNDRSQGEGTCGPSDRD